MKIPHPVRRLGIRFRKKWHPIQDFSLRKLFLDISIIFSAIVLDPFGLASATDRFVQDAFLQVVAPLYRNLIQHSPAPITVVLIDEPTLLEAQSFPLDDMSLVEIIRRVRCSGAATVFVDILIGNPRPSGQPMATELPTVVGADYAPMSESCKGPVGPLYVADLAPLEPRPENAAAEKAAAAAIATSPEQYSIVAPGIRVKALRVPANWDLPPYQFPLRVVVKCEQEAELLATQPKKAHEPSNPGGWVFSENQPPDCPFRLNSPAFQLFNDLARRERSNDDGGEKPDSMVIGWGWKQPAELPPWYTRLVAPAENDKSKDDKARNRTWLCRAADPDATPFAENDVGRYVQAFGTSLAQLLFITLTPLRKLCGQKDWTPAQTYVYPLTISAAHLLRNDKSHEEDIEAAIRGRAVLIGIAATAASDTVVSPVHGVVPGVIIHAQALDNLLAWHSNVWRPMTDGDDGNGLPHFRVMLATAIAVFFNYAKTPGKIRINRCSLIITGLILLWILATKEASKSNEEMIGIFASIVLVFLNSLMKIQSSISTNTRLVVCGLVGVLFSIAFSKFGLWAPISWAGFITLACSEMVSELSSLHRSAKEKR